MLFRSLCFFDPFLPYDDDKRLIRTLTKELSVLHIKKDEIAEAVKKARAEQDLFHAEVGKQGELAIKFISLEIFSVNGRAIKITATKTEDTSTNVM